MILIINICRQRLCDLVTAMRACVSECVRQPVALLALAPPTPPTEGHPIFDKMITFIIIIISITC